MDPYAYEPVHTHFVFIKYTVGEGRINQNNQIENLLFGEWT